MSSIQKYFQDQLLAQAVFKVFDKDGSGTMDFIEFMQARGGTFLVSILCLSTGSAGTVSQHNRREAGVDLLYFRL